MQGAVYRCALPFAQRRTIVQRELRHGVGHVLLHRVQADSPASGNLTVGHAVSHHVDDTPLGRSQDVRMPGPASLRQNAHAPEASVSLWELHSPSPEAGFDHKPNAVEAERRSLMAGEADLLSDGGPYY